MRLKEWAGRVGVTAQTAYTWVREDRMPVAFTRTESGTIIVHDPRFEPEVPAGIVPGRVVLYARVSSHDQKDDLVRQGDRLKAFAAGAGWTDVELVSEVGSGMNGSRRKLSRVLSDPQVAMIVVEHRDRLARMNTELVEACLSASGGRLVVVEDGEVEDDLVRDMVEVLTSFCARLYGRRSAKRRAQAAMEAAAA